jgi:serine/threonine protein kinase
VEGTPFGRYRLIELLGRGGMGEVWRAYDPSIDRVVALKVLPASFADDQVFQERFRREARSAAGLDEPHVVPIHEFGEIEGRLYVTMRLIKGCDLQDLLEDGPLPPERAVKIIEQIASALNAAHEVGLVHRDVKPSNILVTKDDFAYLIDFGIARAEGETGLTSTGATIGTWAYMAPERFRTGIADARADTYALTCVLCQSLTGDLPFPAKSLEQIAVAHMMEPPPKPSQLRPEVPAAMDDVIATGMAKDPDNRYTTTVELAHAARDALTVPIPRPAPSPAPNPPSTEQPSNRVTADPTILEDESSATGADQPPQRAVLSDPSVAATEQADWTNQPPTRLAPTGSASHPVSDLPDVERLAQDLPPVQRLFARVGRPSSTAADSGPQHIPKGFSAMTLLSSIFTCVGAALLTAALVLALIPFDDRNDAVERFLAFGLAIAGVVLLIVVFSRRNSDRRGRVLLSVVLLSAAVSLILWSVLYHHFWLFKADVYICAVFSVLGLLFVLLPLRGHPATPAIAKGFVAIGAVVAVATIVESLMMSQGAMYGGDCPHSLLEVLFAHACPDWISISISPLHYLFLDLVLPAAVGVVLLVVGVTLRAAVGKTAHKASNATE